MSKRNRNQRQKANNQQLKTNSQNPIIKTLVVRPARVDTADIGTWKTAVNNAKKGDGAKLYDLIENILSDGVLSSALERRINKVANAEITFQKDGKAVDEIDDLIDTPEFEELIKEIALSRAYGRSAIDVWFAPEFGIYSFPRKHIKITDMEKPLFQHKRIIVAKEHDRVGYDISADENIISCGKDDDLGYLFKAAQYVIYKRGGFGDWSQYVEIFGMPFLLGKYNAMDENQRDQLFEALAGIGGNPRAAVPDGTDVEVHDTGGKSTNLYDKFRQACNEEILISVLGQTMTTTNGSSRSQAEVHESTEEGIAKSDRRYVQRVLNKYFLPLLIKRGYNVAGGKFSFPDAGENISTKERLEMGLKLRKEGLPVDEDYFFEITGIPKGQAEPTSNKKEEKPTEEEEEPTTKSKKPKAKKRKLFDFFADASTTGSEAISQKKSESLIAKWITSTEQTITNLTDTVRFGINIDKLFNQAVKDIYKKYGKELPKEEQGAVVHKNLFEITNTVLQKGIDRTISAEFGKKNPEFLAEFKHNTAVFSAFKGHRQTKEIIGELLDENGNLRSFYNFNKAVRGKYINRNYNSLRTEYNMAVRSARTAEKFKRFLMIKHLYPNLEYLESSASDKRKDHLKYVGTVLPIDHKWWDTHIPPSEWGCECGITNTDKPVTAVPRESKPINPVFANNPAKTAEIVNAKEHPYVKSACKNYEKCQFRKSGLQLADAPNRPECNICILAKEMYKNIKARKLKYKSYDNKEWKKEYFNKKHGGYIVVHKGRIEKSQKSKNEKEKFNKEMQMCLTYAKAGYTIEVLDEQKRVASCDVKFNNILADLKKTKSHNNIVKYAKKAVFKQGAEVLLFEFEQETDEIHLELNKLYQKHNIKAYYFFTYKKAIHRNF